MDLHCKSELKEQLTEHLYTIIHQNEVRKAKKLADLMKELEMENGEDSDLQLPELPPLSSFQQTNLHLSPATGQTVLEHSNVKVPESSPNAEGEKLPEPCDKNSNTIVILPTTQDIEPEGSAKLKSNEIDKLADSNEEITSQNSGKVMPSFTIVEDGEPVSVVYDVEQDAGNSDSSKCVKSETKETPVHTSETEQLGSEQVENTTPKVKTKWDFDGTVPE